MGRVTQPPVGRVSDDRGFSLVEVLIATLVLTIGVLSLVGVLGSAVQAVSGSSFRLIAREKAREAIESVHAARDTGRASWTNINNVSQGGVFLDGEQPLHQSGADGIVNTADDAAADPEYQRRPGPDGLLGTIDDVNVSLATQFFRNIRIEPIINPDGTTSLTLRQIVVTIRYQSGNGMRTYSLRTYVSSYS